MLFFLLHILIHTVVVVVADYTKPQIVCPSFRLFSHFLGYRSGINLPLRRETREMQRQGEGIQKKIPDCPRNAGKITTRRIFKRFAKFAPSPWNGNKFIFNSWKDLGRHLGECSDICYCFELKTPNCVNVVYSSENTTNVVIKSCMENPSTRYFTQGRGIT